MRLSGTTLSARAVAPWVAVAIAGTLALNAAGAAAASIPVPDQDPFYAVPTEIANLPDGTILASRQITAMAGPVPLPANAWEVKYKTLDNQDQPTATVTTVLVPKLPWLGKGPRPVVSYQTAEDGVGTKCSASYALHAGLAAGASNSEGETAVIATALLYGWAVVAPDYEGPHSQFIGSMAEAHGVLDGIRAALKFGPAGFEPSTPVALWGYSGGALASSLASQLQASYAPDLHFVGIALGGVVGDVKATFKAFNGSVVGGGVVVGYIGLNRSFPQDHLEQYLTPAGKALMAANQTDCLAEAAAKYPFFNANQYTTIPNVTDLPVFTQIFHDVSPVTFPGTPTAPVYDYHAIDDELAPIGPDRTLMQRFCAAGVKVDHVEFPVGEHLTEVVTGAPGALGYLADRFGGKPAPSTC